MDDEERLLATPATFPPLTQSSSQNPLSSFQLFRQRLKDIFDAPAMHWSVILLCLLDFTFTLAELVYGFLEDSDCSGVETEEPPLLVMTGLLSAFITTAFLVEIPLEAVAFGPEYYISERHHLLHCLDGSVIIVAFILEVLLEGKIETVASLVIVLRLWRLAKLLSTLEVGTVDFDELTDARPKVWAEEKREMADEMGELRRRLAVYEGEES